MKVVLAGGSGSLGTAIAAALVQRGDEVVILTRRRRESALYRQVEWDGRTVGEWKHELAGAAVINLAGELVDRRPTPENVELLRQSRVQPTLALKEAADEVMHAADPWIQLSTLAIYGDAGDAVLTEESSIPEGLPQMTGVAEAWEAAAATAGRRQVILRTGTVLQRHTPALDRLEFLVRMGLGGRVGSGKQWVSWIHVEDFVRIVLRSLDDRELSGVVHATSPAPVTNAELMRELRRAKRRPPALPTPALAVKVGARVLGTDPMLGLTGRRCVPRRLEAIGFEFRYPELPAALEDLLPAS